MKNKLNLKAKTEAKMEPHFSTEDFILELLPLLKDNFIAKIHTAENAIVMRFLNGQQMILNVH